MGSRGIEFRLRKKNHSHSPPIATGSTTSAQVTVIVREKFGSTIQIKSTYRISISHTASQTRRVTSRLNGRDNRIAKGTAKWNRARNTPKKPQPPLIRFKYQLISSGKSPAQIISHCENEKYAHSMMKVSISLPWSWTKLGFSQSDIGLCRTSMRSITTAKQTAESPCPAKKINP